MDIPERFRDGDDADEDCTALPGAGAYLNQSVFGMIAAAGSQVDFNSRFDAQSSDDDDESGEPSATSSELQVNKARQDRQDRPAPRTEKNHRRKFSESKLVRSLSRIGSRSRSKPKSPPAEAGSPATESHVDLSPPKPQPSRIPPREPPVMSRMLEAKAELSMRPSFDMKRLSSDLGQLDGTGDGEGPSSSLAKRLKEIFQFEKSEDVIEGKVSITALQRGLTKI
jgi:sterol 3beta-glucosyltransferase